MIKYLYFFLYITFVHCWRFFPLIRRRNKIVPKKYITIMPGGIRGFYMLGICKYLQEQHELSNYHFLGASAGAWGSLICCYNNNIDDIISDYFESDYLKVNITSPNDLQYSFRAYLLDNYNTDDFDLKRLNIGLCILEHMSLETKIINHFNSLERAIDCCIVSSHIPYITSKGFIRRFDNKIAFDGGLSSDFPPRYIANYYIISPYLYDNDNNTRFFMDLIKYKQSLENIKDLYRLGYENAKNNDKLIQTIFER